ncbi:hypothetical protein ACTMU2_32805 [Cupriavidus basilensis]
MEHWLAQSPPLPFDEVFQWWADMVRAAWQPWLALNPALATLLPAASRDSHLSSSPSARAELVPALGLTAWAANAA